MPIVSIFNAEGEAVNRYQIPLVVRIGDYPEAGIEAVREHRKGYASTLNELHVLNKQFQADRNFAACKELKDVIRHFTQAEKAATLVINWFEKQTDLRTHDFPQDLAGLLDYEFNTTAQ